MTNIKERILHISDLKGIKKEDFFKDLGFSYANFKGIQKKSALGSDSIDIILSKYPDIDANWLLTGKGEMLKDDNKQKSKPYIINENDDYINESNSDYIPLIPIEAIAGKANSGTIQIQQKDIIGGYIIPEFKQKGVNYMIRVSGSSMYPKYSSGDLLGCKIVNDTSFFQWGKIYVLDTDQGPMVKRLFPTDNNNVLECRSDNKEYPPFPINKESIYKIAIVVGVLRLE